jgi:cell division protein FtsN
MNKTTPKGDRIKKQLGAFFPGLVVGLLIGLAAALGVTLYINKVPVPFVNKVPYRTADEDAAEAQRNRNWDPNAQLNNGSSAMPVPTEPAASAATAPAKPPAGAILPPANPVLESQPPASAAAPTKPAGSEGGSFYVQAGAFSRMEEAEQQKARLAMMDLEAKVSEKDQSGRTIYRVRLGPFEKKADADNAKTRLELEGIDASMLQAQ